MTGARMSAHDARQQTSRLIRGVKLSPAVRGRVAAIHRKYEVPLEALNRHEHAASGRKGGDERTEQQIAVLAARERADVRAVLPASSRERFDANAAALQSSKH